MIMMRLRMYDDDDGQGADEDGDNHEEDV